VTIGSMTMSLMIRQSRTLKDKRRVVKSLKERIHNKFNVSVAEIGSQNHRQQAVLAFALVSGSRQFANTVLNKIVDHVRAVPPIELIDYEIEML